MAISINSYSCFNGSNEASDLELVRWFNGTQEPDTQSRKEIVEFIKKCHAKRMGHEGV